MFRALLSHFAAEHEVLVDKLANCSLLFWCPVVHRERKGAYAILWLFFLPFDSHLHTAHWVQGNTVPGPSVRFRYIENSN